MQKFKGLVRAARLAHSTSFKKTNQLMGGACGAYGGEESCAQGFGGEAWGKETTGETHT